MTQNATTLQIEKPRTLILDCNRFELATLAASLRIHGIDVVGEAFDSRSATQLFRTVRPDVVVVSFQSCDDSIINATQVFRQADPEVGLVLLSPSSDLRVFGFSEFDLPRGTQLVQRTALRELDQLNVAIEESLAPNATTQWTFAQIEEGLQALTDIQIETLRLLAQGFSNGDIAKTRYVSEKSVEQTIGRIASHLRITHEHGRNLRVILASEFYRWMGAPKPHISK